MARGVGPGWSCGRVWLGGADPASSKGSCLPEHSWWPHWNCYWFILMWRWADLRPVALSDEVFPASRFRKNTKLLCWGRKKKKCWLFFSLYLQTPPQKNVGERRIAYIQWEILSLFFSSQEKNSTHKSKQDGALEPHLLTWGNREREGKMPGRVPSIQHWACSTVMWHLKL